MKTQTAKSVVTHFLNVPYEQVKRMGNQQMFALLKENGWYFSTKQHVWLRRNIKESKVS